MAAIAVTADTDVANSDSELLSMLATFHNNLGSHLKSDDDTQTRLDEMENQLLDNTASTAADLIHSATQTVGNIARISPYWKNRKSIMANQLERLYVAIVCVDKSAADLEANPQTTASSADRRNNTVKASAEREKPDGCLSFICCTKSIPPAGGEAKHDNNLYFRIDLLRSSNELLTFYGDNTDAQWVTTPIYRMLLEVLYSLPAVLARIERSQWRQDPALEAVLQNLSRIREEGCVLARLVVHAAKSATAMMVDHRRHIATAAATVILGAAKSVLTIKVDSIRCSDALSRPASFKQFTRFSHHPPVPMPLKVDATLLDGLHKSAVCAFEMFKHYKAADQFEAVKILCPSLPSEGALVDYAQLLVASQRAESSFENWLLTSAYINNLMKVPASRPDYLVQRSHFSPYTCVSFTDRLPSPRTVRCDGIPKIPRPSESFVQVWWATRRYSRTDARG